MSLTIMPPDRLVLSWNLFDTASDNDPDLIDKDGNPMDACTRCKFSVTRTGSGVEVEITKAFFKIRMNAQKTSDLLKHEQGHADLAWLASLASGRECLKTKGNDAIISKKHEIRLSKADGSYDVDTKHGTNISSQAHWNHLLNNAIFHKKTQVGIHFL